MENLGWVKMRPQMKKPENRNNLLVVITGPTASGKTDFGISLAKHFKSRILSADSRQVYKELNIGVARPDEQQLASVPHHFIATHDIAKPLNAGTYEEEAVELLENLFQTHRVIFMVGGSGLYIQAVCEGFDQLPEIQNETRVQLNETFKAKGLEPLLIELKKNDPDYYEKIDLKNPHRILRALEIIRTTGKSFSGFQTGKKKQRPFRILKLAILPDKEILEKNIRSRTHWMFENKLVEEVRGLLDERNNRVLQTVGYQEIFKYLDGEIGLEGAEQLICTHTRQYAKRQVTWIKRDPKVIRIESGKEQAVIDLILRETE